MQKKDIWRLDVHKPTEVFDSNVAEKKIQKIVK